MPHFSHTIAVDDAPFARDHRGNVLVVGVAFSGLTLEGVLTTHVRRDGRNATVALQTMITHCRFAAHTQALLLQGIALAGFNVVDIHALHEALGIAVVVVARRRPNLVAIQKALLTRVRGGARKWKLIERAGAMESAQGVYVQRAGITLGETEGLISRLSVHGRIPEPLRTAHLIAGGVTTGHSQGRT